MSQMENLLMGGDSSGSDSDGEASSKVAAATQVTASTAGGSAPRPPQPPQQQQQASKSALTNRLKSLYGAPGQAPMASPGVPTGGPLPRGPPPTTTAGGAPVAQRRGSGGGGPLPAPLPPGRNLAPPPAAGGPRPPPGYAPPMVHGAPPPPGSRAGMGQPPGPHNMQRGAPQRPGVPGPGQPPPGTVGRVPAPLPAARTANRSAPPTNRVASVPAPGRGGAPPVVTGAPPPSPLVPNQPHGQSRQYQHAPHLRGQQPPPPQPHRAPSQMPPQQMQQQQRRGQPQPPQPMAQQLPPPTTPSAPRARATPDSRRSDGGSSANMTDEEKKEKERFLMFTRVLMKYLEQRDAAMHKKAKDQIKECYEKNKQGDPNFRSLTTSMKARLRSTVGELYWKKAHDYLDHFLKQKKDAKSGSSRSGGQPQQVVQEGQPLPEPSQPGVAPQIVQTPPQHPPQPQIMAQSQAAPAKKVQMPPTVPATAPKIKAAAPKGKSKESDEERKKREKRNEQNRKRREKRKKEQEAKLKEEAKAKAAAAAAATGVALPKGMGIPHSLQASLPGGGGTPSATSSTASATSASSAKAKEAASKKKKKKAAPAKTPSIIKRQNSLKQTSRLIENVDHAVLIDVKTIPNLLSKEHKLDVNLNEEQRILLYGDEKRQAKVKDITKAAAAALAAGPEASDAETKLARMEEAGVPPLPWKLPAMYRGWGDKNVLDVRTAWSKVRLPEFAEMRAEREKEWKERMQKEQPMGGSPSKQGKPPVVAERAVSSGGIKSKTPQASMPPAPSIKDDATNHLWYNETRAEADPTLAMLSEATETFLKSAIENAIGKARLRQNLDGVRLWHTLHAQSVINGTSTNGGNNGDKPPPALIRLGCDVNRQIALAEGNAAKTCQRMEEALSRRNDAFRSDAAPDPDAMLLESTSMADLSTRPPLKSAAQTADLNAKRKFAVFGGSESQEPPLGRVPKQATVTLQDIVVGELGNQRSMIGARRKRFRVGLRY